MSSQNEGKGKGKAKGTEEGEGEGKGNAPPVPDEEQYVMISETGVEKVVTPETYIKSQSCLFLDLLNQDCRINIYLGVFGNGVYHLEMQRNDWVSGTKLKAKTDDPYHLALLETCHEVHEEARLIPYKKNIFDFGSPMNLQYLLNTIANSAYRDAMRTVGFDLNVTNPKEIALFKKDIERHGIRRLNDIFANVDTIIIHCDLRLQRRGIRSAWEYKIEQAEGAFDAWETNRAFLELQQFFASTSTIRSVWKAANNVMTPNHNVKIIFHVILLDGRHYDKTTFLAGPANETVRPRPKPAGTPCEMAQ